MATAKRPQAPVRPSYTSTDRGEGRGRTIRWAVLGLSLAALVVFAVTGPGTVLLGAVFTFLEFYSGVFSLVALSLTVMGGLLATDRVVLLVRHRILLQAVHRALATTAMVFLGVHVTTKVVEGHATLADAVIPFLANHRTVYIGLGTIAGWLMIAITVTGVLRGRFAGTKRPWLWRTLHASAYLCWPVALLHGLNAGRAAKTWVVLSYALCLIGVGIALLVRLTGRWGRTLRTPKSHTSGVLRPVAVPVAPDRVTPPRAMSPRAETSRPEPFRAGPFRPEPSRAEPSRPAPFRPAPSRAEASPAEAMRRAADRVDAAVAADASRRAAPSGRHAADLPRPARSTVFRAGEDGPTPLRTEIGPERIRTSPVSRGGTPAGGDRSDRSHVGRATHHNTDTITDEEFWSYLRAELDRS